VEVERRRGRGWDCQNDRWVCSAELKWMGFGVVWGAAAGFGAPGDGGWELGVKMGGWGVAFCGGYRIAWRLVASDGLGAGKV
jgi:hypothetical protein